MKDFNLDVWAEKELEGVPDNAWNNGWRCGAFSGMKKVLLLIEEEIAKVGEDKISIKDIINFIRGE